MSQVTAIGRALGAFEGDLSVDRCSFELVEVRPREHIENSIEVGPIVALHDPHEDSIPAGYECGNTEYTVVLHCSHVLVCKDLGRHPRGNDGADLMGVHTNGTRHRFEHMGIVDIGPIIVTCGEQPNMEIGECLAVAIPNRDGPQESQHTLPHFVDRKVPLGRLPFPGMALHQGKGNKRNIQGGSVAYGLDDGLIGNAGKRTEIVIRDGK